MALDTKFIDQFANVTARAALASSYLVGKKNKIAADEAAVDAKSESESISEGVAESAEPEKDK